MYVLDSDVFIQAARQYYAFDIAPKFWESLKDHATTGRIKSIDRVQEELDRGKDELAKWADVNFTNAFHSTDEPEIIKQYGEIVKWVQSEDQFLDYAKSEFSDAADGWLVAYAKVKNHVVVTQETFEPNIKNRVKIPNVCERFNVPYVNAFEMLRLLAVRL